MSEAARSVMRNSAFMVGTQAAVRLVNLVVLTLLTRYLGPELYGRYNYAVYLGGVFSLLADFRLNIPLVRQVARAHQEGEAYLHRLLSLRLLLGGLCVTALVASLPLLTLTVGEKRLLLLAGLGMAVGAFSTTYAGLFQARERMEFVALQALVQTALGVTVTLLTIWLRGPVWWVVGGLLLANLASTLLLARATWLTFRYRPWRWTLDLVGWRRLLAVAAPLAGVALLDALHFRNDLVLLRHFHGERVVGIYGVPFRLTDALLLMELAFLSAVFPVVSRLYARSEATFQRAWEKLLKLVLILGLPLGLSVQVVAPHLLSLFGTGYAEGSAAFRWIIWVAVLAFIGYLIHFFLITLNLQNWILLTFGAALAANLSLNLWLIPRHALLGASVAKVISEGIAVALAGVILLRRMPSLSWRCSVRPALATVAMGALLWVSRGWGVASLIPGLVAYGSILWLTGAIEPDEVALLLGWLRGGKLGGTYGPQEETAGKGDGPQEREV